MRRNNIPLLPGKLHIMFGFVFGVMLALLVVSIALELTRHTEQQMLCHVIQDSYDVVGYVLDGVCHINIDGRIEPINNFIKIPVR